MIKINFLPEQSRKKHARLDGDDFGGIPGEVIVGALAALIGFFVLVHVALAGIAVYKMAFYKVLEVRWSAMGPDKKIYDEISGELKVLHARMNTLRPITSAQQLRWSKLLNDLSDSVPKGVWLRQISFDKGELEVHGSAVSKIKNEMAEAGNFVAAFKEKQSVKNNFHGVDIASIQRRSNLAVSVADFSLKARVK